MARLKKRRELSGDDVPTSSFSDIAFLLIIFFILVTSLQNFAGFKAQLPAGEKSAEAATDKMPAIKLHNGDIHLNDQKLDLAGLRRQLTDLNLGGKPEAERIVLLEATGKVPYQQYYEVMSLISHVGGVVGIVQEGE